VEVSRPRLDEYVSELVLAERGDQRVPIVVETPVADGAERLAHIQQAIDAVKTQLDAAGRGDRAALYEDLDRLYEQQESARAGVSETRPMMRVSARTFAEEWAAAGDDVSVKRELISRVAECFLIAPTIKRGPGAFDTARLTPKWRQSLADLDLLGRHQDAVIGQYLEQVNGDWIAAPKPLVIDREPWIEVV
jgi:hypothetical protein